MPLTVTPAVDAALQLPSKRIALLADLQFNNEWVYASSGIGPFVWSGNTYKGAGDLGKIEGLAETCVVEAKGIKLTLSGIPSELVMDTIFDTRIMKKCNIRMAVFDATFTLIPDPVLVYSGNMDVSVLDDNGKEATITISVESVLVDMNRMVYRRFTDPDQQMDLVDRITYLNATYGLSIPTNTQDTGFTHVPGIQDVPEYWGVNPP
jgi:hypothetical protein